MLLQYVAYSFPTEPRLLSRRILPVPHFAPRVLYHYATASLGTRLSSSAALASLRPRSAARGHFGKAPSAPSPNPWPIEASSRPSLSVLHKNDGYWLEPIHAASSRAKKRKGGDRPPLTPGRSALSSARRLGSL
jgi:hypothetical protein